MDPSSSINFVNKNRSVSKDGQSRYEVAIRLDFCCSLKIFLLPLDLGRGLTADWRHLLYISRFFWSHIRFALTLFLPSFANTYSYNSWLTDGISCTWIFATTYLRCLEFVHDRVLVPCFSLPDKPICLLGGDSNENKFQSFLHVPATFNKNCLESNGQVISKILSIHYSACVYCNDDLANNLG